jgi:DNA-binding IclR family transcriptional regulator
LIDKASEEMLHLSQLTNETIDLRINLGLKNIGLCLVQSKYDQITVGDTFRIRPVYLGVDGRVLLSQLDDITLSSVLEHVRMEKAKKFENINTNELMDEIRIIRQQGYAIVHDELIKGVTCICAPVHNYITPAVLSIVGPEMRIKPKIQSYIEKLLASSNLISKEIAENNNKIQ